uniref:Uncharacterized protein n=1 Tax=Rhizophora mucronata TaxID=61149 RepID=A0A2P2ILQ5_RHIMU
MMEFIYMMPSNIPCLQTGCPLLKYHLIHSHTQTHQSFD